MDDDMQVEVLDADGRCKWKRRNQKPTSHLPRHSTHQTGRRTPQKRRKRPSRGHDGQAGNGSRGQEADQMPPKGSQWNRCRSTRSHAGQCANRSTGNSSPLWTGKRQVCTQGLKSSRPRSDRFPACRRHSAADITMRGSHCYAQPESGDSLNVFYADTVNRITNEDYLYVADARTSRNLIPSSEATVDMMNEETEAQDVPPLRRPRRPKDSWSVWRLSNAEVLRLPILKGNVMFSSTEMAIQFFPRSFAAPMWVVGLHLNFLPSNTMEPM